MKRNLKEFRETFNRWKNGERYWSIVGQPLPHYSPGKNDDSEPYVKLEDVAEKLGTPYFLPEVVVTPRGNKIITTTTGKPAMTASTWRDLGVTLYTPSKQLKMNQPSFAETNTAANERADEYANRVSPSALDIISAGTLGGLNNLSPTQWVRRAYDLGEVIKGNMSWNEYGNRFFRGNEGVVSADYAKAYPYRSMAINTIGDIGAFGIAYGLHKLPNLYNATQVEDFLRRNVLSYKKLGTYSPYKTGSLWNWDANGKLFGRRIGEGSEMDVFENLKNSKEVLKIETQGYPSISEAKKAIRAFQKRNLVPHQEKAHLRGYTIGPDAATRTKLVYYPVYSLKRLKLETNTTPEYWEKILVPKIDKMLHDAGYRGTSTQTFTNGKYTISDISPYNIGYDNKGNLKFLDFYVE